MTLTDIKQDRAAQTQLGKINDLLEKHAPDSVYLLHLACDSGYKPEHRLDALNELSQMQNDNLERSILEWFQMHSDLDALKQFAAKELQLGKFPMQFRLYLEEVPKEFRQIVIDICSEDKSLSSRIDAINQLDRYEGLEFQSSLIYFLEFAAGSRKDNLLTTTAKKILSDTFNKYYDESTETLDTNFGIKNSSD